MCAGLSLHVPVHFALTSAGFQLKIIVLTLDYCQLHDAIEILLLQLGFLDFVQGKFYFMIVSSLSYKMSR